MKLTRIGLALLALSCLAAGVPEKLAAGKGRFVFTDWAGPELPVWYYAPVLLTPMTPVVFVMHGAQRNADDYRDQWVDLAERYAFLLLVPEFSVRDFPDREGYNFGNVLNKQGAPNPRSVWGYTAIEGVFEQARRAAGVTTDRYFIYGHSAGSQFVHRMLYFAPEARARKIVAANAGAYMLPDFEHAFPYGLKGSGLTEEDLRRALQTPAVILLGEADVDPNHHSIPKAPEAMAQGLHRFARGLGYFKAASEQSVRLGVPFGWKIVTAPGVGHSNAAMAAFAAAQIFRP
jgi:poly(3-hydroxybutyrate) depolymerase